jgi:hypothetical protein
MSVEILRMEDEKVEIRKWLLLGEPATGKTTMLATFPRPMLVFSCDLGYSSLKGMKGVDVVKVQDRDVKKPNAWRDFSEVFKGVNTTIFHEGEGGEKVEYKTIAIDGIGFLGHSVVNFILATNMASEMQIKDWGKLKRELNEVVKNGVLRAEYLVVTCLLGTDKDEITGEILYAPAVQGSAKDDLPAWFDAVLYTEKRVDAKTGAHYTVNTVGDRKRKAKVRIPEDVGLVLPAQETPDFRVIYKKIQDAVEKKGGGNKG